jgi:hypothetical protein
MALWGQMMAIMQQDSHRPGNIVFSRTFPGFFQDKITIFQDKIYKFEG